MGNPIVIAPLCIYSDDTSGNRSKKWNKFDVWCASLACLSKYKAREVTNIFFIGCSNRISADKMTAPIVEDLLTLEKGILVYDSFTMSTVLVISPVICLMCDELLSC